MEPGELLRTTVYVETMQPSSQDFGLFLHLDRPDGETVAAVDVLHPDEIPMHTWPAGFYVRAPLRLTVPADTMPIRYTLNLGIPENPGNGRWLPLADGGNLLPLGHVWVEPAGATAAAAPIARFGDNIALLAAELGGDGDLHLRWRADAPANANVDVGVHYLDAAGQIIRAG